MRVKISGTTDNPRFNEIIKKARDNNLEILVCNGKHGVYLRTYNPNRKLSQKEMENRLRFTKKAMEAKQCEK